MLRNKIGFKSVSAHLDELSQYLKETMVSFWDNLGFDLTQFYITSIDIDTSSETGRRVAAAISQQSAMSITGHTWQQEQMFGVANNAIDGLGNGNGGLIGGLMAMNMMSGMGGATSGGMMNPQYKQPSFGSNNSQGSQEQSPQSLNQIREVYCSNCSRKFLNTHRFCPHCGDTYNPCSKCGTDNDRNAKRCVSCGIPLQGEITLCSDCNAPLVPDSPFCENCGKQVKANDSCTRCGAALTPNTKFCPKCGNKR